ncbi:MAG: hypothetical protein AB7K41_15265 [Bdellovibrionales bacterium]
MSDYQEHLIQTHPEEIQQCPFCDEEVFVIDLASHQKHKCKAVITTLCEYCEDEILELYYNFHINWHNNQQREELLSLEGKQPNNISNFNNNDSFGDSSICRHCGRFAIPSEGVCYFCAGAMK